MSAGSIDLGSLKAECAAAGLCFSLESRAHLLAPSQDDFATPTEGLTISALTSDGPSICCQNNFRFAVRLVFDHTLDTDRKAWLVQAAASRLKSAKLWEQLHFEITAADYTFDNATAGSIKFTLSRSELGLNSSRRCKHKLRGTGAGQIAATFPQNDSVRLECIDLAIEIGSVPGLKCEDGIDPVDIEDDILDIPDEWHEAGHPAIQRPKTNDVRRTQSSPHPLDNRNHEPETDLGEPVSQAYVEPNPSMQRSYSTNDLDLERESLHFEASLLSAFDSAILLAITTDTKRTSRGIRVVESSSFKPLAAVMPDIWSPGHFQALSSRSLFLPTISHALNQVCGVYAMNTSLQHKMQEVYRRAGKRLAPPNENKGQRYPEAQVLIAHRLSKLARQSLRDLKTSDRLRIRNTDLDAPVDQLAEDDFQDLGDFDNDEEFYEPDFALVISSPVDDMLEADDIMQQAVQGRLIENDEDELLSTCSSIDHDALLDEVDTDATTQPSSEALACFFEDLDDNPMLDIEGSSPFN